MVDVQVTPPRAAATTAGRRLAILSRSRASPGAILVSERMPSAATRRKTDKT